MIRIKSSTKAMPDGPLESMFPVAISKILDFLSTHKLWDYSVSDIAEGSGIGRTTLFRIRNDFTELNIVKHTRDIGNAKLYKLNLANPFVKKIVDLFDTLVIEPLNERKKVVVEG